MGSGGKLAEGESVRYEEHESRVRKAVQNQYRDSHMGGIKRKSMNGT